MLHRIASRLTILVVDDDPLLLRGLEGALALWGVGTVLTATDGEEAARLILSGRVDLLLTDWVMPRYSGAELVRWLREGPNTPCPDLPAVVLTGRADVTTVRAAWTLGVDAVLVKPVAPPVLAKRIEAVLERRRDAGPAAGAVRRPPSPIPPTPDLLASMAPVAGHAALPAPAPPDGPRLIEDSRPRLRLPRTRTLQTVDGPARRARRARLLMLLDRMDAAADQAGSGRLHLFVADLLHAAAGVPLVEEIAASLAVCIADVRPGAPGQADAVQAHVAAMRWALNGDEAARVSARTLLRCLRASVVMLARRAPVHERPPVVLSDRRTPLVPPPMT